MKEMKGVTDFSWSYSYTEDGDSWHDFMFYRLDEARKFAREVVSSNRGNKRFNHFATRICPVNTAIFFDDSYDSEHVEPIWH